jgi:hypothetical protein
MDPKVQEGYVKKPSLKDITLFFHFYILPLRKKVQISLLYLPHTSSYLGPI